MRCATLRGSVISQCNFAIYRQETGGAGIMVVGEGPEKEDKSRGAPHKDPLKREQDLWNKLMVADAKSSFFAAKSDVQKRLIVRWCNTLRTKVCIGVNHLSESLCVLLGSASHVTRSTDDS